MSTNTFAPPSSFLRPTLTPLKRSAHVIVVGAGAFGGWTALSLLRAGRKVTLIDAWGPGNSRSSSGDETRVIRSTYGGNEFYFDMNVRALKLWKENETRWKRKLFHPVGVLWMCYSEKSPLVDDSIPFAQRHGMMYEHIDRATLRSRFPQINTEDIDHAWFDPYGGYLLARESCQAVAQAFVDEGGNYLQTAVSPGPIHNGKLQHVRLSDGTTLQADAYLFACGSWMGKVFPDVLGTVITCTKQEAYYFGVPEGESDAYDRLPAWVDLDGNDYYYGIPGNARRGFKIGVDRRGVPFDPTLGERMADPEVLLRARKFIGHRFPGLRNAPLVESRVCPYENSPDGNFVFDKHPGADNLIFLGGGSGHGFKHGPALGEWVAGVMTGSQ